MNEKTKNIRKKTMIVIAFTIIILLTYTKLVNAETNNWKEWQDESYWDWHTRETWVDQAYNGKHIKIENDAIDFFGYGDISYKDFLYKEYENPGEKKFIFSIDESKANYHTLEGAGFLFNSSIKDGKLSGYILLFTNTNVIIYRVENLDVKGFEETPDFTIYKYALDNGEEIVRVDKTSNQIHNLVVIVTPKTVIVTEDEQELINQTLDTTKHVGNSFGLIASYVQHDCSVLSQIEFSQFDLQIKDYEIIVDNKDTKENVISGSKIALYNKDGELIQTETTDEDGKVKFTKLNIGEYTFKQIEVSDKYKLNTKEYKCIIDEDGNVKFIENDGTVYNEIIEEEKIEEKVDNTIATTIIPKAGKNTIILVSMIMTFLVGIYSSIKIKQNKDIK